jgi:hypothetical protein
MYVVVLITHTLFCKSFKNTDKMKKYYFKTTGWDNGTCTEKCKVKDNGVMIGSVNCQICQFCVEHQKPCEFTGNVDWIKCSKIDEARE